MFRVRFDLELLFRKWKNFPSFNKIWMKMEHKENDVLQNNKDHFAQIWGLHSKCNYVYYPTVPST